MKIIKIASLVAQCQTQDDIRALLQSNHSFYVKYAVTQELLKEAGWKENIATGLLAAIMLVMSGEASPAEAARTKNVDLVQLNKALKTFLPKLPQNKQRSKQMTKQPTRQPIPTQKQAPLSTIATEDPSADDLFSFISNNEGYKKYAYLDPSKKNMCIGVGCNIDRPNAKRIIEQEFKLNYKDVRGGKIGLNEAQIKRLFNYDVAAAIDIAKRFVYNYNQLPKEMKTVLIDMAYNMGEAGINKFQKFKAAVEQQDFKTAAKELQSSKWYAQVKNRGVRSVGLVASLSTPSTTPEALASLSTPSTTPDV